MAQPNPVDEPDVVEIAHRFRKRAAGVKADFETVVAVGLVVVHAKRVSDVVPEPARPGRRTTVQPGVAAREPAGAGLLASSLHRDVLSGRRLLFRRPTAAEVVKPAVGLEAPFGAP